MAYGTRVLGPRSFRSSLRTGKPSTRAEPPTGEGKQVSCGQGRQGTRDAESRHAPPPHPRLGQTTSHRQGKEETGEPDAVKVCAMSRTERIATRGGRSSRQMTPRRPPHLDPKGRGNNSMVGKQEMSEDVYGMVLQRLRDRVRAGLPKSQCPVVEPHTRR